MQLTPRRSATFDIVARAATPGINGGLSLRATSTLELRLHGRQPARGRSSECLEALASELTYRLSPTVPTMPAWSDHRKIGDV